MKYQIIFLLALVIGFVSCEERPAFSDKQRDLEFENKFLMKGPGFTGADGVYSVRLSDGRDVWIFGDTFIGEVSEEHTREKTDPLYIRNSFLVSNTDGGLDFMFSGELKDYKSKMIPEEVSGNLTEKDVWYWPGDGFELNGKFYVFNSRFVQETPDMWGFKFRATDLLEFNLPELNETKKFQIPYSNALGVHYGHAVYEDEEYIYVYGLGGSKPHVARFSSSAISSPWEFYTGTEWSSHAEESKPMVDFDGSEQFSVFQYKDSYYYISQLGMLSDEVYIFSSETPYGPWDHKTLLFKTENDFPENSNVFTYNALVHPQFIKDGFMLFSYNTNSMELEDHFKNTLIYRPRFIRISLDEIKSKTKN